MPIGVKLVMFLCPHMHIDDSALSDTHTHYTHTWQHVKRVRQRQREWCEECFQHYHFILVHFVRAIFLSTTCSMQPVHPCRCFLLSVCQLFSTVHLPLLYSTICQFIQRCPSFMYYFVCHLVVLLYSPLLYFLSSILIMFFFFLVSYPMSYKPNLIKVTITIQKKEILCVE